MSCRQANSSAFTNKQNDINPPLRRIMRQSHAIVLLKMYQALVTMGVVIEQTGNRPLLSHLRHQKLEAFAKPVCLMINV